MNIILESFSRIRLFCLLCALPFFGTCVGQSLTTKEWEVIRSDDQYVIGVGMSNSIDVSRQMAIKDLASKISAQVESRFSYVVKQSGSGRNVETETAMQNIMHTYTSLTLNNMREHVVADKKGQTVVYRFIKKSDLRALFKKRVSNAKMWAQEAYRCEKERKIGDALQYYYWSLALLRSCPDGDLETMELGDDTGNMMQRVFAEVKGILSQISISTESVEKDGFTRRLILDVKYKGEDVVNLNYKYFDGKHYSAPYTAKNGTGELVLPPNAKLGKLCVYAEYECREEANINPELRSVMESTSPVPFQLAKISVNTVGCKDGGVDYVLNVVKSTPNKSDGHASETKNIEDESSMQVENQSLDNYLLVVKTVLEAIKSNDLDVARHCFSEKGWDMFNKLIGYGEAKLMNTSHVAIEESDGEVVCRGVQMSFSFKSNKRTFVENVVFYMGVDGKIGEVAFGLEQSAIDDIMRREAWSGKARNVMIHFLETYKTAYALNRIDYLESVFSDNALIIVGTMVSATGQKEMTPANLKNVKYTRQTKSEYLKGLRRCFDSNEYVNIHFADNIVRKATDKEIYGIQIKQDYFSSSYGDSGYLFLLIGFDNPNSPIIHVRTWQPDDDPNIRDGRIGMADFNL